MTDQPKELKELKDKSTYYLAVLSALAKRKDKRSCLMLLKYGNSFHASIVVREGVVDVCILSDTDKTISLKKMGREIYLCLNDLSFGDTHLTKHEAMRLIEKFKEIETRTNRTIVYLVWKHSCSGIYHDITHYWMLSHQLVLKDSAPLASLGDMIYKDKFTHSRSFDYVDNYEPGQDPVYGKEEIAS